MLKGIVLWLKKIQPALELYQCVETAAAAKPIHEVKKETNTSHTFGAVVCACAECVFGWHNIVFIHK